MSYFQRVPEHGSKTERTEDNQQEPDPESKALKSEEEEEEDDERNDEGEQRDDRDFLFLLCALNRRIKTPTGTMQEETFWTFLS